ncbi:hypothetical protein LX32DRAFT_719854 [Colletotrichum zoysiae]|uniref:Uncharacterized protein n=1 Tax=Colletotrichum zoysiae TaxID=1216348 RepID=A0AAD9HHW5_9PEZI|nr:hypothetical protein LX32DRAFT_719854 [Colletotrichum zoysiae]
MANANRYFLSGSVRSFLLWFLLHVLLINASPTALVPTQRNGLSFPTGFQGRIEKGRHLIKLFPLDEEKAAEFNEGVSVASTFKDPSALKLNGWSRYIYWFPFKKNTGDPPGYDHDLDNAFADSKYPVDQTKAGVYHYRHDRKFGKNKKKKPTYSSYANVHVPASGAIIFDSDFSPETRQKEYGLGDVPELHRLSDVAFFQWMDACKAKNVDPKSLKVMFVSHVINLETYNIVVDALLTDWHRMMPSFANKVVFSMETKQGQAILGSKWGSALSWMLIQHKKELGLKKIKEVAVWGLRNGFVLPEKSDLLVGTLEMRFVVEDA